LRGRDPHSNDCGTYGHAINPECNASGKRDTDADDSVDTEYARNRRSDLHRYPPNGRSDGDTPADGDAQPAAHARTNRHPEADLHAFSG
jgi:hypothetical protein